MPTTIFFGLPWILKSQKRRLFDLFELLEISEDSPLLRQFSLRASLFDFRIYLFALECCSSQALI